MNDTEQQAAPPPPPPGPTPGPTPTGHDDPGWNTEHLTDFRLLRRSHHDSHVAGVAGGLGRHLNLDPTIIRVLFVVASFFGGAGLIIYTAMWLVLPDDVTGGSVVSVRDSTRNVLVIIALVVGAFAAIGDLADGGSLSWPPLVIIALIAFAWLMGRDRKGNRAGRATSGGETSYGAPTYAAQAYGLPAFGPAAPPAPPYSPNPTYGTTPPSAAAPPTPPPPIRPWEPRRNGPILFWVTLALIALALGGLGVYAAAGNDVTDAAYPTLALAITGVVLVVGSFFGRPGGLILVGLVSTVAMLAASIGQPSFDGERDLLVRPTTAVGLGDSYTVPAGRIEVDLTRVQDLAKLDGQTLELSGNAGEIVVIVPRDLGVDFSGNVDYGGVIDTPTGSRDGWNTTSSGTFDDGDPVAEITIDVALNFGHIELRQS